jgi:hypothetical protein
VKRHGGCRISGSSGASEIPLPPLFLYLGSEERLRETGHSSIKIASAIDFCFQHRQVGSLAGAAHLLNNNAGVLRGAQ